MPRKAALPSHTAARPKPATRRLAYARSTWTRERNRGWYVAGTNGKPWQEITSEAFGCNSENEKQLIVRHSATADCRGVANDEMGKNATQPLVAC